MILALATMRSADFTGTQSTPLSLPLLSVRIWVTSVVIVTIAEYAHLSPLTGASRKILGMIHQTSGIVDLDGLETPSMKKTIFLKCLTHPIIEFSAMCTNPTQIRLSCLSLDSNHIYDSFFVVMKHDRL
jgi:hypothetical protein